MTIKSPCTGACLVDHDAAICTSCGRSLADIASWLGMSDVQRDDIMRGLAARRPEAAAAAAAAQLPFRGRVGEG